MMVDEAQEVRVGNQVFNLKKHECSSITEKRIGGMGLGGSTTNSNSMMSVDVAEQPREEPGLSFA